MQHIELTHGELERAAGGLTWASLTSLRAAWPFGLLLLLALASAVEAIANPELFEEIFSRF